MSFDQSASVDFSYGAEHAPLGNLGAAFKAAGKLTPHEQAVKLLDECWQKHKPDVTDTRVAFSEALTDLAPMIREVIGDREWMRRINAFTRQNSRPLAKALNAYLTAIAQAAPRKRACLKDSPDAIRKRVARAAKAQDRTPPAAQSLTQSYRAAENVRTRALAADRKIRGVTLAKVEIDPCAGTIKLLSKLPIDLRSFGDWTVAKALDWCDTQLPKAQDAMRQTKAKLIQIHTVRNWCMASPRMDLTLGEQLTPEIISQLTEQVI